LAGSVLHQWFRDPSAAPVDKIVQENFGLRIQERFGMEDRGLLQVDLGQAHGLVREQADESLEHKASWFKAGFEWDSFDYHTLPTDGFLTRISVSRAFQAQTGPTYSEAYLRLRRLWPHLGPANSPLGLDLDSEFAVQEHAPQERWFIAGGSDSLIGTRSAGYLAPNMGILRVGFPFTAATFLGVAIQAVPRLDYARISADYRDLYKGQETLGYGLVLRGALRSLYLELAGGKTLTHDQLTGNTIRESHLGFLIGTRPFDVWKGR
jgi:hypothetical protein